MHDPDLLGRTFKLPFLFFYSSSTSLSLFYMHKRKRSNANVTHGDDDPTECLQQPSTANPAMVIQETTIAFQNLIDKQLDMLDKRAAAYAQKAMIRHALDDCKFMMEKAPTNPVGFLRTGAIHVMQGRYAAAIQVYEQGMISASPDTPGYTRLEDEKNKAQAILDTTHVDFIAALPLDVVQLLVPLFYMGRIPGDQHDCLDVSKTWRERICYCTAFRVNEYRTMTASRCTRQQQQLQDARILQVAPYVVSMHFLETLSMRQRNLYMSTMKNGKFTGLRELYLNGMYVMKEGIMMGIDDDDDCVDWDITDPDLFLAALNRVGRTSLKKLRFQDEKWGTELPLVKVISCCTELEELEYHGEYILYEDAAAFPTPSKLRILQLRPYDEDIEYNTLKTILERCSALTCFVLHQCVSPKLLDLVRQQRPQLQHLTFNDLLFSLECSPHDTSMQSPGLTFLQVGNIMESDLEPLERCFEQWATTLEKLFLHMGEDIYLRNHQLLTGNTILTKLYSIESFYFDHVGDYIVASIIRSAPNLSVVGFSESGHITFEVFEALCKLRHLQVLFLGDCIVDDMDGWLRFLRMHGELGEQSTLKELGIGKNASPRALEAIGKIRSLEYLDMTRTAPEAELCSWSLLVLARELQTFPRFRRLMAREDSLVDDRALKEIAKIPTLECLELWFLSQISDEGVVALANCSRLQKLVVFDCAKVTPAVVHLVRHQLGISANSDYPRSYGM